MFLEGLKEPCVQCLAMCSPEPVFTYRPLSVPTLPGLWQVHGEERVPGFCLTFVSCYC